jgi:hypothetical protein
MWTLFIVTLLLVIFASFTRCLSKVDGTVDNDDDNVHEEIAIEKFKEYLDEHKVEYSAIDWPVSIFEKETQYWKI